MSVHPVKLMSELSSQGSGRAAVERRLALTLSLLRALFHYIAVVNETRLIDRTGA